MKLASRVSCISTSPTLAIKAKADLMKNKGIDVIGLGAGEPDFDTPDNIKEAAIKSINEGFTKYTAPGGTVEIKQAICEKLARENDLIYSESEVIVSCGAKHSLYNIALALFEEGDEIIIPAPYWVSYPEQIKLVGATPVILQTDESTGFMVQPEELEEKITTHTKAIIINTPSNPTGAIYDKKTLESIAHIALKHDLILISDECYERIIYDGHIHYSLASLSPEIKSITLTVNAVSKTYSMTGWRIGYMAGPEWIIKAVNKIQSQTTSNPTSISQKAAIEALKGDQTKVTEMVGEFKKRRDYVVQSLEALPGVSCMLPKGAFYCFPNVSGLFGPRFSCANEFTGYLLDHAKVAVVTGEAFGSDSHVRLSYATGMDVLEKAMERIEAAVKELTQ
ncbi:MAG: pyridoxal phosphate-dependent aminotransferase [bacterium]